MKQKNWSQQHTNTITSNI